MSDLPPGVSVEFAEKIMDMPERKPAHPESVPVKYCDMLAAVHNNNKFRELHAAMHKNLKLGSFRIIPCDCTPRCPPMNMAEQLVLSELYKEEPGTVNLPRPISGAQ